MLRSPDSTSLRRPAPHCPLALRARTAGPGPRAAAPPPRSPSRSRARAKEDFNHQKRGTSVAPRRATVPHLPPGLLNLSTGSLYWLVSLSPPPARGCERPALSAAPVPWRTLRRTPSPHRISVPAAAPRGRLSPVPPVPAVPPQPPSSPPHPRRPKPPAPPAAAGASKLPLLRPGCGSAQRISSAAPLASAARAAAPVDLGCVPPPRSFSCTGFSCTGRASPRWCGRGTRSR